MINVCRQSFKYVVKSGLALPGAQRKDYRLQHLIVSGEMLLEMLYVIGGVSGFIGGEMECGRGRDQFPAPSGNVVRFPERPGEVRGSSFCDMVNEFGLVE